MISEKPYLSFIPLNFIPKFSNLIPKFSTLQILLLGSQESEPYHRTSPATSRAGKSFPKSAMRVDISPVASGLRRWRHGRLVGPLTTGSGRGCGSTAFLATRNSPCKVNHTDLETSESRREQGAIRTRYLRRDVPTVRLFVSCAERQ